MEAPKLWWLGLPLLFALFLLVWGFANPAYRWLKWGGALAWLIPVLVGLIATLRDRRRGP